MNRVTERMPLPLPGTTEADFVNRNGFLPYEGGLRVGLDLTLLVLAAAPLVLLWLPANREFFAQRAESNAL